MKNSIKCALQNLFRLFRFVVLYAAAVAFLFLVLPAAASLLETQYEALSGTVKIVSVSGFFAVIAVWQVIRQRERMRAEMARYSSPPGSPVRALRPVSDSAPSRVSGTPRRAA